MDAYLVGGVRTAIGRFNGSLASVNAINLGAVVVRELIRRSGLPPGEIDEVILGNVIQAGLGQNPARQVAVQAGLPYEVPSYTINKVCGSGLKSVALAAQAIALGESDAIIAGGVEHMSGAPYLLSTARWGQRLGHSEMVDSMLSDALWDAFCDCHMGITAENIAERFGISRREQDEFAAQSQAKAARAFAEHRFDAEIVAIEIPGKRGTSVSFAEDEHARPDVTLDSLAELRPAFKPDGTVTAGNSSGINDGAAGVLVVSEAMRKRLDPAWAFRIRATHSAGVAPEVMGLGPVPASRGLLHRVGMDVDDLDLVEVNEAFAAQSIQVHREMGWDLSRVNVLGGAIALGHPVGASGTRILVTLMHELVRRKQQCGLATLCIGGGQGIAMLIERV